MGLRRSDEKASQARDESEFTYWKAIRNLEKKRGEHERGTRKDILTLLGKQDSSGKNSSKLSHHKIISIAESSNRLMKEFPKDDPSERDQALMKEGELCLEQAKMSLGNEKKAEEHLHEMIEKPGEKTVDQLKEQLQDHSDQIIEALRFQLAQKGLEKRQTIRDTRPENIDEYNAKCQKEYKERYYTRVFPAKSEEGRIIENTWDIYTGVHGYENKGCCYLAQLIFEKGKIENVTFIEKYSYKRRPLDDFYSGEEWRPETGRIDEEVEYKGTKPQNYDKILFNMIEDTLEDLEKKALLPGERTRFAREQLKIVSDKVIDPRSQEIMDYFIDQDDKEAIYPPESLGFQAMLKAPLVGGKFYFAEHHYTNREVKTLELEKRVVEEDDDEGMCYYITFILGNKEENDRASQPSSLLGEAPNRLSELEQ